MLRLRIDIKLFVGSKLTKRTSRRIKSRLVAFVQEQSLVEPKWTLGTCRVWYDLEKDYWNEFTFMNVNALNIGLASLTDPALVKDIDKVINK